MSQTRYKAFFSISALFTCLFIVGCTAKLENGAVVPQMANPAATHCIHLGGVSETKTDESGGQYAICNLPDGTVIEEWELFRRDNPQLSQ